MSVGKQIENNKHLCEQSKHTMLFKCNEVILTFPTVSVPAPAVEPSGQLACVAPPEGWKRVESAALQGQVALKKSFCGLQERQRVV